MARCSSYQKPGRGRGEKIKAGTTVVNCGALLYEVAFFNCSFILMINLRKQKYIEYMDNRTINFKKTG